MTKQFTDKLNEIWTEHALNSKYGKEHSIQARQQILTAIEACLPEKKTPPNTQWENFEEGYNQALLQVRQALGISPSHLLIECSKCGKWYYEPGHRCISDKEGE